MLLSTFLCIGLTSSWYVPTAVNPLHHQFDLIVKLPSSRLCCEPSHQRLGGSLVPKLKLHQCNREYLSL
jgi:hypothetical protein